jgi:cell division topological specificity factor
MNVFRSLQLAASAPVARERLHILLEYERKLGSQIDLFGVLREEILAVISRHIVDPEKVEVTVDRGAKFSTLGVNIELPNPGGKARTLPTDCAVLQRDKTVGRRGLRVNKRQLMRGVYAAPGSVAVPIWLAGATVGAILLAVKRAGSVPLITVGLIAALVLGASHYAQQSDVGKRRTLDDRETALMAGFEGQVNPPRPTEGVVSPAGPSVALPGMGAPGTVGSLPRHAAAPEPVSQSAAITPLDAPGSVTSSPQNQGPAAAEPDLQSAPVTRSVKSSPQDPPPVAAEPDLQSPTVTGSVTSPPHDPPPAAAEPDLQSATVTGSVKSSPQDPPPVAAEPDLQSATVTGSVTSPPHDPQALRDPAAVHPVLQSAPVTGSVTSPPHDPQALRDPAAVHPVLQSAAVTPPATLGSAASPPNEQPTAPSQEPPGSVTPLPPRRPLQIRIATPPRAVPPPALLRRREAP